VRRDYDVTLEKPLPANLAAERMILGIILLDNAIIEQAIGMTPDEFFGEANRIIFGHMLALRARGRAIDPLTLQEELWRAGELERVGGPSYIAGLFDGVPRFSNIEEYVRLVRNTSRERQLIHFAQSVIARAFDGEVEVDEQLRVAEQGLIAIGDGDGGESHWRDIADVACEVLVESEARAASGRALLDFSTGFRDLDYLTDGFERGTLVVIGAAPKMGKTGLALSMTRLMSESKENLGADGRPPLIAWYSMEMSAKQQARRFQANIARVDFKRFRTGYLSSDEWRRVAQATQKMTEWRVRFDDRPGLSLRAMREGVRRLKIDEGQAPDVIFVDYLQLANGERQRGETREQEVARISTGLTSLAKDYNLTLIALSQLNRQLFNRPDKKPHLGDFRDSGQIAQDATLIMGLHRDQVYNTETPRQNIADLLVLAARDAPIGSVELVFMSQMMAFEDKWNTGD
jgi:replicative DNA helicase